jgi:hypothetical protein
MLRVRDASNGPHRVLRRPGWEAGGYAQRSDGSCFGAVVIHTNGNRDHTIAGPGPLPNPPRCRPGPAAPAGIARATVRRPVPPSVTTTPRTGTAWTVPSPGALGKPAEPDPSGLVRGSFGARSDPVLVHLEARFEPVRRGRPRAVARRDGSRPCPDHPIIVLNYYLTVGYIARSLGLSPVGQPVDGPRSGQSHSVRRTDRLDRPAPAGANSRPDGPVSPDSPGRAPGSLTRFAPGAFRRRSRLPARAFAAAGRWRHGERAGYCARNVRSRRRDGDDIRGWTWLWNSDRVGDATSS